jgi:hypothetical protein
MASKHQAAAKRKVKKKKYKGKYPGPDKWKGKGDPAKRKPAAKKAPAKKAAPAPKPVNPNLGTGVGTSTDSNGNLKLQTNYEIESQVLEADRELAAENERAAQMEGQSLLTYDQGKKATLNEDVENRTAAAGRMANRGMRGTAAMASSANVKQAFADNRNAIDLRRQNEKATATGIGTAAAAQRKMRQGQIDTARKDWTDKQSKLNPTVGTTPVNSGVTPIKATPPAARAAAKKKVAKKKAKPFKGKRPGPG